MPPRKMRGGMGFLKPFIEFRIDILNIKEYYKVSLLVGK